MYLQHINRDEKDQRLRETTVIEKALKQTAHVVASNCLYKKEQICLYIINMVGLLSRSTAPKYVHVYHKSSLSTRETTVIEKVLKQTKRVVASVVSITCSKRS